MRNDGDNQYKQSKMNDKSNQEYGYKFLIMFALLNLAIEQRRTLATIIRNIYTRREQKYRTIANINPNWCKNRRRKPRIYNESQHDIIQWRQMPEHSILGAVTIRTSVRLHRSPPNFTRIIQTSYMNTDNDHGV